MNLDHVVEIIQNVRVSHDAGLPVFVDGAPERGECLLELSRMRCAGRIIGGLVERPHMIRILQFPMLTQPVEGLEDVVLCALGHPISATASVRRPPLAGVIELVVYNGPALLQSRFQCPILCLLDGQCQPL